MHNSLSLFVGLRYSLTKKHNFLLSFTSVISMLGICLGVLVLIVALSVINGSITVMRDEALKAVPHAIISGPNLSDSWEQEVSRLSQADNVLSAVPFIEGDAIVRYQGEVRIAKLRGVSVELESNLAAASNRTYLELLEDLKDTKNGIILGVQLAGSLGIYNSQELTMLSLGNLLAREVSDAQGFEVVGFADFGLYGNDSIALTNLDNAQKFFENDSGVDLQVKVDVEDIFRVESILGQAIGLSSNLSFLAWSEAQAGLFSALNMEKILTALMLLMIIVIGAVNIISTLVMVVSDKSSDIAILRTMGASRSTVLKIFIIQGMISGILGTFLGALLGIVVAVNMAELSLFIENFLNRIFPGDNLYLISHLQTKIAVGEIILVCSAALIVSFFATLYPAFTASKLNPAEALRYE